MLMYIDWLVASHMARPHLRSMHVSDRELSNGAATQHAHLAICGSKEEDTRGGQGPGQAGDWAASRQLVADALLLSPL